MMSAFVAEAIADSISLPVKLLLRTAYNHAGSSTLTPKVRPSHAPAGIDAKKSAAGFMNMPLP
jgi:hypothetical protein